MKYTATIGVCFCFALVGLSASARAVRPWSKEELMKAADLVVVATPMATKDLNEENSLGWERTIGGAAIKFRGVETTFKVIDVLQGKPPGDQIVLHHYRIEKLAPPNGPMLFEFTSGSTNKLVLFLKKDGDNRYAPVAGQVDPGLSIRPFNEADASRFAFPPLGPVGETNTTEAPARHYFENYLSQCGTNEVRCLWFLNDNSSVDMVMTIDLNRETVFTVRDVYDWARQASETRTLSHSQVITLRQIINELPSSDTNAEFSSSLFVAKRNGGKTAIFQYDRIRLPPVVRRIYDIGGGYLP
jgi:hypothetical protein